jgi:hypothetical protein
MSRPARSLRLGTGSAIALAGGGLLVVALGAVGIGLLGVGGGEDDTARPDLTIRSQVTAPSTTSLTPTTASRRTADRDVIADGEVYMEVRTEALYGQAPPVVDALHASSVLRITASGFAPGSKGLIEQCTVAACANPFPVLFDASGSARIQYLVRDSFADDLAPASTCRAKEPPCVVRLRSNEDAAFVTTVFHDPAPPPRRAMLIEPRDGGLVDGERVRVGVTGFIPGERVQAMLCVAPDDEGSTRCGAPGPVAPLTVDANGRGQTELVIEQGRVGTHGASCNRSSTCGIAVSPPGSLVPAPIVRVVFAAGPGARYGSSRLLTGLTVALGLLALAVLLSRTTDWRKPSEAETPELDRATLT